MSRPASLPLPTRARPWAQVVLHGTAWSTDGQMHCRRMAALHSSQHLSSRFPILLALSGTLCSLFTSNLLGPPGLQLWAKDQLWKQSKEPDDLFELRPAGPMMLPSPIVRAPTEIHGDLMVSRAGPRHCIQAVTPGLALCWPFFLHFSLALSAKLLQRPHATQLRVKACWPPPHPVLALI
ncbi:hypothetical protein Cadr_000014048 [Camelus dromedarius]|uniref:Uncharacterized protein n=1 Tax=Camelus dromedarius TaxID=9838 RepID=A0A5N4DDW3_CAMDR|nr:hypothetical protein Cadr_000014048 [Camelus dromedarius]